MMTRTAPRKTASGFASALLASTALVALSLLAVRPAAANPDTPTVIGGAPTITGLGTNAVQVDLTQARTIIDWGTFSIDPGDTTKFVFGAKNWIVLNRVNAGSATINGNLLGCLDAGCASYGGNIWLYASDGILVGGNGIVNTGGLLLTTSPMTTSTANFLGSTEPTPLQFSFGGSNMASSVSLQAGAQVNGFGGTIALVAPSVSTASGSSVATTSGQASALYGATGSYRIQFTQAVSNDLDLVSFEVPAGQSGGTDSLTPISLGGATNAGSVYIAAVRQTAVLDALINITGTVTATQASSVGGNIVLSAGGITNNAAAAPDATSGKLNVTVGNAVTADNQLQIAATGTVAANGVTAVVTAAKMTGTSNGGASFNAGNHVAEVDSFTNSGSGGFLLNNAQAVTVAGPLTNTVGDISLSTTVGGVTITGTVDGTGHVVTIASFGGIAAGSGVVKAATLTGSSGGAANFSNSGNVVGTLGSFTNTSGAFTLADSTSLAVNGTINAAGQIVTLNDTGSISQTGGTITAATLTGKATGTASFGTHAAPIANLIGTLAAFNAPGGFSLTNNQALTVSGTDVSSLGVTGVTTTNALITLETDTGSLTLGGSVSAGNHILALISANDITQTGGVLTANLLTGISAGTTQLGTHAAPRLNQITSLGAFQADGGFSLTNNQALNVTGTDLYPLGITGVATNNSPILLETVSGTLTLQSVINAGLGSLTLASAADISQTGGTINAATLNTASSGNTILSSAGNTVGSVSFTTVTGDFTFTDSAGLVVLGGNVGGNVFIDPPSIDITGAVVAGGSITLLSDTYINSTAAGTISSGAIVDLRAGTGIDLGGVLQAATLTGFAGDDAHFGTHAAPVANLVGTLAAFSTGTGFTLTNNQSLNVSGVDVDGLGFTGVDAGAGVLTLETLNLADGDIIFTGANANLTAGAATGTQTVSLISAGAITQAFGNGKITTKHLTGTSVGGTTLAGANDIGELAEFQTGGGFSLTDNRTLDVTGANLLGLGINKVQTLAGDLSLMTTGGGDLHMMGPVDAGANILTLVSTGLISQTAGTLKAGTLTGSSAGTTTLNMAGNLIGTLGAFDSAGAFSLTNGQALTVSGVDVDSLGFTGVTSHTGNVGITTAGGQTISGSITTGSGKILTLVATGGTSAITQTGGVLTAGTLTGKSTGATQLGTHGTPRLNVIGTLGAFKADGGFSLTNNQALTVSGADVSALAITGVTTAANNDILIETRIGGETLNSVITAGGTGKLALVSAADITQTGGILTAGTLTGKSALATQLGTHAAPIANLIGTLGAFKADGGFSLTNNQALTVSGADVSSLSIAGVTTAANNNILIETDTGSQTLSGIVTAGGTGRITLVSALDITQTAGALTASALTGKSIGTTQLGTHAAPIANMIGTLAAFSAPGGFSLTNNQALAVSGLDVSLLGFTGVTTAPNNNILIETDTGGETLNSAITAGGTGKLTLVSAAGITQTGGVLTAGTLTGKSSGATQLGTHFAPVLNLIGTLGAFRADGGFSLTNNQALNVSGADVSTLGIAGVTTAPNNDIWLETKIGGETLNGVITAGGTGKLTLVSAAGITQGGGVLTAGTLTGTSAGATQLGTHAAPIANLIGTLGAFNAPTGFSLTNNQALTVTGADVSTLGITGVTTTNALITLETDTGSLTLNGSVNAGTNTLALVSAGAITQTGGGLTANLLTGKSAGATQLGTQGAPISNGITTLGAFKADGGFSLTNGQTLTVTGADPYPLGIAGVTTSNSNILLETTSGNLVLQSVINAGNGTLALVSAGSTTQSGGVLTAGTLTGSSAGATQLGTQGTPIANHIGTLASFSAAGGFSLTDAQNLAVTGPVTTVNGNVLIDATAGDLSLSGNIAVGTTAGVTLLSSGSFRMTGGRIDAGVISLGSGGDILIGDNTQTLSGGQTFLAKASSLSIADLALFLTTPESLAGAGNAGHIYLNAHTLNVSAPGRIVQQNTGTVLAPLGLQLVQTGVLPDAVVVANPASLAGTPTIVALYGTLKQNGIDVPVNAFATSGQVVLAAGVSPSQDYRINNCVIHQTGSCTNIILDPPNSNPARQTEALLVKASDDDEDQDDPTITGSGNPEIWQDRAGD